MKNTSSWGPPDPAYNVFLRAFRVGEDSPLNDALAGLSPEIERLVRNFSAPACDVAALEQAARFGALKAAAVFDAARSSDFSAFARMIIKDAIRDELGRIRRRSLATSDNDSDVVDDLLAMESGCSPSLEIERKESASVVTTGVQEWISNRTNRQREFFRLHFSEGYTKAEVARAMGVSKAAVTKMYNTLINSGKLDLVHLQQHIASHN